MADTNAAQDQIKTYVDRILRMKEEAKAINADIREIYAEAKGNGFDKTTLGKLVTYVEKRQTDADAVLESESLFDLYLTAYDRAAGVVGTKRATHTHAPEDRQQRSRARLSEAMDDNKAFSAERLSNGLISEQAHAENVALSDAAAEKLGAGAVSKGDPVAALRADPAMHIVSASSLKTNPEAKASEDGGTTAQDIETPADSVTGDASRASVSAGSDAQLPVSDKSVEAPASAAPRQIYAAPGVITWEHTPPEGVKRHDYSYAFGDLGQDSAVIEDDLANAAAEPIVKIGPVILDGWARYIKTRSMVSLDGKPVEYSVAQYDGTDPLMDCIRWNVAGRILNDAQKRTIAQRLARLEPNRKEEIYTAFELGMELVA
jgi:uncharacterized protein (UPF0335 family)